MRGNWDHNYPKVIQFLHDNGYEFKQMDVYGQHLRIYGSTCLIDLWPSRMTYHVIESEFATRNDWPRLSFYFKSKELKEILERSE